MSDQKQKKRGRKGAGSITKRGNAFYAVLNTHDPKTGKRTRRWSKACASGIAAQAELNKMMAESDEHAPTRGLTLGKIVDDYIEFCETIGKAATTVEGYRCHRRRLDQVANIAIEKLTASMIDAYYARLASDETRSLSPTTIAHTHSLINSAFKWAHRKGRINRNPMTRVDAPQRTPSEADALQIEEAVNLLEAIKGHRLEAAMKFALGTGMRRGEVCGLKWTSVDLNDGNITVREARVNCNGQQFQKETKTKRVRQIPLGEIAMDALRLARKQYNERKMRSRPLFVESGFVFIDEVGRALHPNALTDAFRRVYERLEEQGFPHRRLHDLRHTAGTFMLASGMDINTVQEVLGHTTPVTTLQVYGHVLKGRKKEAIQTIDAALGRNKTSSNVTKRNAK